MIFKEQKIKGVFLIEGEPFEDDRGAFRRNYCQREFEEAGIDANVAQCNVSENKYKNTLRGFHYQLGPHGEAKTLTPYLGAFYDIVVDLRKDSPTFMQWQSFELRPEDRTSLHVPKGCANAFFTLEDNSVIHYYSSAAYHPSSERGVRYNDPQFNFEWPCAPEIISEKDAEWADFDKDLNAY